MNTNLEDNYRHKGLRKQLVDQLRTKGITDEAVLSAINEVPRHTFLDSSFVELAYRLGANHFATLHRGFSNPDFEP